MTTKYRGAVVPPLSDPSNYTSLLEHSANILRYEIVDGTGQSGNWDAAQWKAFIRANLDGLDSIVLPLLTTQKVVIDIHCPPGGMIGPNMLLFSSKPWGRIALLSMWEEIAERYKYNDKVLVYGILNEPGGTHKQVASLMLDAVNTIRGVDKHKRIAVTTPHCNPLHYGRMPVLPGNRIWYESHMYHPIKITGQGIDGAPAGLSYPSQKWNKKKLMQILKPQREFQVRNNTRMYVGEFSISKFADTQSRLNYLGDLIAIFHSYGWHWSYHAWRESPVWDVESTPEVANLLYTNWAKNRPLLN